ncbi:unnamed protein product [Phaedon cochleariae]|uniref:Uncharacterized protein n=1 Tax=Phaedon cochleariae TaxID=80249 RepID=A0A9N9X0S4_PHACE|nr:unnamed protein product [Phaedon cochleariae]
MEQQSDDSFLHNYDLRKKVGRQRLGDKMDRNKESKGAIPKQYISLLEREDEEDEECQQAGSMREVNQMRYREGVFDDNLVAVELKKAELIFNKPLYIGMCILDLSKIVMYDFHYNFMLPKLGADVKLMYTDTDSFIYEIVCDDAYSEVIDANIERFDTSDYAPDNIYGIPRVNKKVLGLLKDEANGKIITHFAGLRSKMYIYKLDITDEDIEKERKRLERKGFSKERLDRELENFEHVLTDQISMVDPCVSAGSSCNSHRRNGIIIDSSALIRVNNCNFMSSLGV